MHCAAFHGHERCVWVLLDVGKPDLDLVNAEGQTALVKAYTMLWQRPAEPAVRAVLTLAQFAGAERVRVARKSLMEEVRKRLKLSRALVKGMAP